MRLRENPMSKHLATKQFTCAMHGKQTFAYSEICGGFVCIECIKENLYIEDVEKEMVEDYPELF
jgi:hypothetical protein